MLKSKKILWTINIIFLLLTIFVSLIIDMKGSIYNSSIFLSNLIFGLLFILGLTTNVLLLINKTNYKLVCYILIIFYLFLVLPFFTHSRPSKDRITVVLVKKYIWPEGDTTKAPNIPDSLVEVTYLKNISEIDKSKFNELNKNKLMAYNPAGFENKTWVAYYKSNNLDSIIKGVQVLWHDGHIERLEESEIDIPKDAKIKFYLLE